jgi:hypothetical protein
MVSSVLYSFGCPEAAGAGVISTPRKMAVSVAS